MGKKIKEVDAYIKKSADFAKPVLIHFRELVHKVCPEVEEKIKWSFPHFDYKGAMMCSMASFKQHCAISFWKAALMTDASKLIEKAKSEEAMGHLGKITSLKDLPKDALLIKYIKEGMKLNEEGQKLPAKPKTLTQITAPDYFLNALKKNKAAQKTFDSFNGSNKKEYILWVTEAKTEATRSQRLTTAIEWMSEGKIRKLEIHKKIRLPKEP
ncbi:MAG: hypothetical protein JWO32_3081 [Bacteroidetes bacterium]|nr:hypothetical protein [Bacteroidota bacterium]